jgi:hypothetical protein
MTLLHGAFRERISWQVATCFQDGSTDHSQHAAQQRKTLVDRAL